jgi:tripartite-type tricarboxylate transporter receptor subunit TctC
MKISRRHLGLGTFAILCCAVPVLSAAAQEFPDKPIRLIVPYPAGGPADSLARAIGPSMSLSLRQAVVIENRAGASGTTGLDAVAKSLPNGYTIGMSGPGPLVAAPFMMQAPYDATKDFAPIARIAQVSSVIVVPASSPYKTLGDLIAAARAAPGKITFGSAGAGTLTHLAGELMNIEGKVKLLHVPYRGAAPAAADLLGGHIDVAIQDLPGVISQIQAGSMRALAVTSQTRSPSLPDVPTTVEAGFPNVISDSWYGIVGPAGTPPAIQNKLFEAITSALKSPEVMEQIARLGAFVAPSSPQNFSKTIAEEQKRWKRVIEETGTKM